MRSIVFLIKLDPSSKLAVAAFLTRPVLCFPRCVPYCLEIQCTSPPSQIKKNKLQLRKDRPLETDALLSRDIAANNFRECSDAILC